MDCRKTDRTVTEQGPGSPVPVGVGSGRTGSPRPSSLYCHAPTVDYQAGELVSDTGYWPSKTGKNRNIKSLLEEISEESRRETASTPASPNTVTLDLTWDEEKGRSTKRKRPLEVRNKELVPWVEDGNIPAAIRGLVTSVDKEVRQLSALVQEHTNTKKEIKEITATLRSMMSRLMSTKMQEVLGSMGHKWCEEITPVLSVEDKAIIAKPPVQDALCQTENSLGKDEIIKTLQRENAELKKEIMRMQGTVERVTEELLQGPTSFERFEKLEKMKWPNEIYRAAFLAKGSPLGGSKEADLLVLEEEERWQRVNEEHRKAMYERFPELIDLEGRLAALTVKTGVIGGNDAGRTWERWVVRAEVEESQEEWFNTLTQLRRLMVEGGRNRIGIYPPGQDKRGIITRKMLEFIFRGSGIKCIVFAKEGNRAGSEENSANDNGGNAKVGRKGETDALVVSRTGETYVETLRRVKETIKPDSSEAKSIRTIRKSKDGKMVIVVDNSDPAAVNKLVNNLKDAKGPSLMINMRKGRDTTSVTLKDIDCLITKEEVKEALVSELGGKPEDFTVGELRPYYGGNQAVTIRVQQEKADMLVRKGTLRIGLSLCSIKERLEVAQCYKCFKHGHTRAECKEQVDLSSACKKCGEVGHFARECTKELVCLNCKRPGHAAGSGQCPEFRKALSRVRANAKAKWKY